MNIESSPEKIEKYFENIDDLRRFNHHQSEIMFSYYDIRSDRSGNIKIPILNPDRNTFKITDCSFSPGTFLPYSGSDPLRRYYYQKTVSLISYNPEEKYLDLWDDYVKANIIKQENLFKNIALKSKISDAKFLKTKRLNYLGNLSRIHGEFLPRDKLSKGYGFIAGFQTSDSLPKSEIVDFKKCSFNITDYDAHFKYHNPLIDISLYPKNICINYTSTPYIHVWTEFNFKILYIKC